MRLEFVLEHIVGCECFSAEKNAVRRGERRPFPAQHRVRIAPQLDRREFPEIHALGLGQARLRGEGAVGSGEREPSDAVRRGEFGFVKALRDVARVNAPELRGGGASLRERRRVHRDGRRGVHVLDVGVHVVSPRRRGQVAQRRRWERGMSPGLCQQRVENARSSQVVVELGSRAEVRALDARVVRRGDGVTQLPGVRDVQGLEHGRQAGVVLALRATEAGVLRHRKDRRRDARRAGLGGCRSGSRASTRRGFGKCDAPGLAG